MNAVDEGQKIKEAAGYSGMGLDEGSTYTGKYTYDQVNDHLYRTQ